MLEVRSDDPAAHELACRLIGIHLTMDQASHLAYYKNGELEGVCLFEQYTGPGGSVQLHMAGMRRGWITRERITLTFRYVFQQLQCGRVFGRVNTAQPDVVSIDQRLGFEIVATLEGYFPDSDLVILEMKRENCRWLRTNGQKVRRASGTGLREASPAQRDDDRVVREDRAGVS